MDLQNNLGFSLYIVLFACYIVIISNGRKKSEIKVSTDWYVTIEYWRLSSIKVIFVNYQTSELQCNYQSYIQVYTIGDAWGFSDIASISPSRGFSVETLTEVQLCHRRPSQIGVSLSQKMESPDYCTNVTQVCYKEGGHCGRQAFQIRC